MRGLADVHFLPAVRELRGTAGEPGECPLGQEPGVFWGPVHTGMGGTASRGTWGPEHGPRAFTWSVQRRGYQKPLLLELRAQGADFEV